ncbi:hypothetical protein [Bacillus rubiinfantis]|uniref:hypothetical protein n=1 Tax=Bacillus rubiinfantis TaxID=1499680 RepID=UPI0005A8B8A2|nr:hypothetical protein [Bacillus rubiinfantis]
MEQSGIQEILHALKLHSAHIDEKLDAMKTGLENRMDRMDERLGRVEVRLDRVEKRLDHMDERLDHMDERLDRVEVRLDHMDERLERIDSKLNGHRVEWIETQETVDYLSIKSAQHEKKLRTLMGQ